jgi:integration host factor subunit alpha
VGQNGTPQGMTKADLVELIYERVGSSKKAAGDVVEAVFGIIKESLCRGEKVKISGFGSFAVNHKRARRGRNPQTGVSITIDSRTVLSFKPSPVLKERVCNREKSSASSTSSGSSASSEE